MKQLAPCDYVDGFDEPLRRRSEIDLQRTATRAVAFSMVLVCWPALALDTMEAIGAEKCGGPVRSYEIEFLAPENAALVGTPKVVLNGLAVTMLDAATLSIDGRACANARCTFEAKKGQSYRFAAASRLKKVDSLCIVVARP